MPPGLRGGPQTRDQRGAGLAASNAMTAYLTADYDALLAAGLTVTPVRGAPPTSGQPAEELPPENSWHGGDYGFTASNEMLFTPNFLLAPRALSEMNW